MVTPATLLRLLAQLLEILIDTMNVELRPVTLHNRGDLEKIDPGSLEKEWVLPSWYWHQQSLDRPGSQFRLIHADIADNAVGMIAFGPSYNDVAQTQRVPGEYELKQLVIDARYHRQGLGRIAATAILKGLAALPDCQWMVVTHHPDNVVSRAFFRSLGFRPINRTAHNGNPMLAMSSDDISSLR